MTFTTAMVIFLSGGIAAKIICLAFADYPLMAKKGHHFLDLVIDIPLLIWGVVTLLG